MADSTGPKSPIIITRTMIWVLVISYSLVLVARSTLTNYKMNEEIAGYKDQVEQLEKIKQSLRLALVYYRSDTFKELEARRRLNLKGKDEKVVALPEAKTEPKLAVISELPADATKTPPPAPYIAWWNLFFGT